MLVYAAMKCITRLGLTHRWIVMKELTASQSYAPMIVMHLLALAHRECTTFSLPACRGVKSVLEGFTEQQKSD